MKLSLPLRIFLLHFVFMLLLGVGTAALIHYSFERYKVAWQHQVETLPAERLFNPLAAEIGRSLLLQLEAGLPEQLARRQQEMARALDAVLPSLPSIRALVVVDREGRVVYAAPAHALPAVVPIPGPEGAAPKAGSGASEHDLWVPLGEGDPPAGWAFFRYRPDGVAGEGGVTTQVFESMLRLFARSSAGALLLPHGAEEADEAYRHRVSDGLARLFREIPAIEAFVVVDRERRIRYASEPYHLDLAYTAPSYASMFAADSPVDRAVQSTTGDWIREVMIPIYGEEAAAAPSGPRKRLGSVLVRYRPDPSLLERLPRFRPPEVGPEPYVRSLVLLVAAAVLGGIVLAGLSGLPVRRLERALEDFRARGFRGRLDTRALGLDRDLESAVRAINELGGRLEALDAQGREREALLATLSHSLREGMVATAPDGEVVAWNAAALRLLGEAESSGDPAAALRAALERNGWGLLGGPPTPETVLIRADGTGVEAEVTCVPFEIRPGVTGKLFLLRDLATLRKVESHLLEAGRFAVLAHLAAGMAHEIRNPLHSIQINASVIEQYVADGEDAPTRALRDSAVTIRAEAQRLAELLNHYLGLMRSDDEATLVDLRELCRRVVRLVSYAARQSRVELRLEGEIAPPPVEGIPDRLQQAILNLVLNAIQAMPEGGTVTLRTSSSPGVVRLTVSDTGPGLPPELGERVFDTRVTTKSEGSGLGLPLVRWIVEAHGGSVWYRSEPGRGAAFTIVLPALGERSPASH